MQPIPTEAERKVIWWFFSIAFFVASLLIAWSWLARKQECTAGCKATGFASGSLRLNSGGRFNLGDPISVRVAGVDAPRGRAELDLAGEPSEESE